MAPEAKGQACSLLILFGLSPATSQPRCWRKDGGELLCVQERTSLQACLWGAPEGLLSPPLPTTLFFFEAGFSIVTLAGLEVIEIPLPLPSITPIRSLVEAASGGKWEVQAPEGG